MKTLSVLALTGSANMPSSRFRVRQHIRPLADRGIHVTDYAMPFGAEELAAKLPDDVRIRYTPSLWLAALQSETRKGIALIAKTLATHRYEATWLSRELYPGRATTERLLKRPMVFDVDDAIWLVPPGGARASAHAARRADVVLAGNQYIADWFTKYNQRIEVVPTAVDTDEYQCLRQRKESSFTIGWIGTSSNLRNVEDISYALQRFFLVAPSARLLVVSDRPPKLPNVNPSNIEFVRWSRSEEVQRINSFDVGIMPLTDDEWARGKCSFKMLQYMACEVPCVVSPVGMNHDVIQEGSVGFAPNTQEEWLDAFVALYENERLRKAFGGNGRSLVMNRYSRRIVTRKLERVFGTLR
jgi:glycosyltransferase involved in cell wall biosynthesis